jgi:hypothetical protein
MSSEPNVFSPEQVAERSMLNARSLCLAPVVFAKENGLSPADFWTSIGKQYAPSWEGMESEPLIEIIKEIAFNTISVGATLLSLSGDESKAEAVFGEWPSTSALSFFSITQAEADETWGVFGPIVESLGWKYQWQREGDKVIATVMRSESNN